MSSFSKEELIRYNRQMILPEVGLKGQEKLKAAKVLVIGAGGIGCPALQYLCATGIGTLGIVDFDKIELHNLHRQILYTADEVGKFKAVVAEEKLKKINPHTTVHVFNEMLNEDNAEKIIGPFDVVVDGSDNFLTRYIVNDACVKLKIPLVYGSIFGFEGQFTVFNYKGGKNLRDLFPEPPNAEDVPNCNENGVLGTLPGILAIIMANETLKLVLELEVTQKYIVFDTMNWNFTSLT